MNSKQIEQQSDDLAKAEEIVTELSAQEVEEVSGGAFVGIIGFGSIGAIARRG